MTCQRPYTDFPAARPPKMTTCSSSSMKKEWKNAQCQHIWEKKKSRSTLFCIFFLPFLKMWPRLIFGWNPLGLLWCDSLLWKKKSLRMENIAPKTKPNISRPYMFVWEGNMKTGDKSEKVHVHVNFTASLHFFPSSSHSPAFITPSSRDCWVFYPAVYCSPPSYIIPFNSHLK